MSRRDLIAGLALLASGTAAGAAAASDAPTFKATGLNHLALRVPEVKRSRDFYQRHLGLEVSRDGGDSSCFLTFGNAFLALFRGAEPRMDHYCYSVEGYDVGESERRLKAAGLAPRVTGDRIYFDDPDGIEVQLAADEHRP
jgi:catechol 2,3-dioxygenase-like lactoylglutathione lyase family enzyme